MRIEWLETREGVGSNEPGAIRITRTESLVGDIEAVISLAEEATGARYPLEAEALRAWLKDVRAELRPAAFGRAPRWKSRIYR